MNKTSKSALKELIIDPPDDFLDSEETQPEDMLKELEIVDPDESSEGIELEVFTEDDFADDEDEEDDPDDTDEEEASESSDPVNTPAIVVLPSPFGQQYATLEELGNDLLEHIRKGKAADLTKLDRMLKSRQISSYLAGQQPVDTDLHGIVYEVESAHQDKDLTKRQRLFDLYRVAFLLADEKLFYTDTAKIADAPALSDHMKSLLNLSFSDLDKFCRKMVTADGVLDPQLEAWLLALGKEAELTHWRQRMGHFAQ